MNKYLYDYKIACENLEKIKSKMEQISVGDIVYDNVFYDGSYMKVKITEIVDKEGGDIKGYYVRTDDKVDEIIDFNILHLYLESELR